MAPKTWLFWSCLLISVLYFVLRYIKDIRCYRLNKPYMYKYGEVGSIDMIAQSSGMKDWSPNTKVGLSVMMLLMAVGFNNFYVSIVIILAMTYVTVINGKIGFRVYLSCMAVPFIFILLSSLTMTIEFSRLASGEFNLYVGFGYIYTTIGHMRKTLLMVAKAIAAVSALEMMTLSTPLYDILGVLEKCRVPRLMIELMNLIYRFVYILLDVHMQMKTAARSRLGFDGLFTAYRSFSLIAVNLLVVSMKRANGYYDAMEARGYDGTLRFLEEERTKECHHLLWLIVWFGIVLLTYGIMG